MFNSISGTYNIYKLKIDAMKPFGVMASEETSLKTDLPPLGPVSSGERSTKRQCAGFTWTNGTGEKLSWREHNQRHPQIHKWKEFLDKLLVLHGYVPGVCLEISLKKWMVVNGNWKLKELIRALSKNDSICSDFAYLYILGEWMVPTLTWLRLFEMRWGKNNQPGTNAKLLLQGI